MHKYTRNNRGVALLSVMAAAAVMIIAGSFMLSASSSESKMVHDYGNEIRAFYLAEAGADKTIEEWHEFLNTIDNEEDNIDSYTADDYLNGTGGEEKIPWDGLDYSNVIDSIEYDSNFDISYEIITDIDDDGSDDYDTSDNFDNIDLLKVKAVGSYEDAVKEYIVQLWYDENLTPYSYKGSGMGGLPGEGFEDPEFAYKDKNLNNVYDEGDVIVSKDKLEGGQVTTDDRLIIPPSVGTINAGENKVKYKADEGIYLAVDIYSDRIELKSKNEYIDASEVKLESPENIELKAGSDINIESSQLDAKHIILHAGSSDDTIFVSNAHFIDKDNHAQVSPGGVNIEGNPASGGIKNK
ncbi:MAG: hypothetical protein K9L17_00385 [Clostridiales bacterium]|nr:hypothetical protein [Clostridiales bacterium]MCF8021148.1 hypothetical protein [Clostridiales bacterium]